MIPNTITSEEIQRLPLIKFDDKIEVVDSLASLNYAISFIKSKKGIWGFDTETRPSFKKGKINQVSLVQLAWDDICFLFRINKIGLRKELIEIFSDEGITKIGLSIQDDFRVLNRLANFEVSNFIDLQQYVKNFNIQEKSLKKLCAIVLNARISKSQQISNWEAPELTNAQKIYAATDAWVCLKIYQKLNSIEL